MAEINPAEIQIRGTSRGLEWLRRFHQDHCAFEVLTQWWLLYEFSKSARCSASALCAS